MKRVFGAIAFVIGVSNVTQGIITLNAERDYGVLLIITGLAFIGLGVWLEVLAFRKGKKTA